MREVAGSNPVVPTISIKTLTAASFGSRFCTRVTNMSCRAVYAEFDLDNSNEDYFSSAEWNGIIGKWEGYVRAVVDRKGTPPQLY